MSAVPLQIASYREHLRAKLQERGIPEHLHSGLLAYFTERRPVGSFLRACLENNLSDAVLRADDHSVKAIKGLVEFLKLARTRAGVELAGGRRRPGSVTRVPSQPRSINSEGAHRYELEFLCRWHT